MLFGGNIFLVSLISLVIHVCLVTLVCLVGLGTPDGLVSMEGLVTLVAPVCVRRSLRCCRIWSAVEVQFSYLF